MKSKIAIYGTGMAGAVLASRLSDDFDVTVIAPTDYFEVPMAMPRLMVRPEYGEEAIVPIAEALPKAQYIRGRLVEFSRAGGRIEDDHGGQRMVTADITVLATGSRFSGPFIRSSSGSIEERKAGFYQLRASLASARRILIVGGGPVGVEIAGEIIETWPGRSVTIVQSGARILAETGGTASVLATKFLRRRRVKLLTGERIETPLPPNGYSVEPGQARTASGKRIGYDLMLCCIGGRPNTEYLLTHFSDRLDADGRVRVTPQLLMEGENDVFALGDITDLKENKMALHIAGQVSVAEANIRAMAAGRKPPKTYTAKTGNLMMAVTLGSQAGVIFAPLIGTLRSTWLIRKVKAETMLVPKYRKQLGLPA
ncbi:NAD(P)/FAD-dependent oxidoreductase [Rhizobium sp. NPDC090279]|uniref:NAD(P)/FAD-dependent oxidoreductase n=1 Tax=Rhizobium sp. NPDC090279 TaxID=3364499 RepID=UPI00383A1F31